MSFKSFPARLHFDVVSFYYCTRAPPIADYIEKPFSKITYTRRAVAVDRPHQYSSPLYQYYTHQLQCDRKLWFPRYPLLVYSLVHLYIATGTSRKKEMNIFFPYHRHHHRLFLHWSSVLYNNPDFYFKFVFGFILEIGFEISLTMGFHYRSVSRGEEPNMFL